RIGLEAAVAVGRLRAKVVGEHHAVADEHLVLDRDALADEGMRGDLAARADGCVLLDLDERADARVVPDRAAVQVHQRRVEDLHVLPEPDRISDRHWGVPRCSAGGWPGARGRTARTAPRTSRRTPQRPWIASPVYPVCAGAGTLQLTGRRVAS